MFGKSAGGVFLEQRYGMRIQQTIQFIQIARSVSPCNEGRQPNDERRNVIAALYQADAPSPDARRERLKGDARAVLQHCYSQR